MQLGLKMLRHTPFAVLKPIVRIVFRLVSDRQIIRCFRYSERRLLNGIKSLKKILVISDINIGDAVNIQAGVEALKYYFDECCIDYAYNSEAAPVIRDNPCISKSYPVFRSGTDFPKINLSKINEVFKKNKYDLIINFCPFLSKKDLKNSDCTIVMPLMLIAEILKAVKEKNSPANLSFNITKYINQLVANLPEKIKPRKKQFQYTGNKVYLAGSIIQERDYFLNSIGVSSEDTVVFLNPDTSNPYTFIDLDSQRRMITKILESPEVDFLLIGTAHNFKGIEDRLVREIPIRQRDKIIILPESISLALYASIVDISSVYITGDTGPMHIAAARKVCINKNVVFTNNTTIVSIFKATEPRIYGYDSFKPECLSANQDAASKVFESRPTCKNISCCIQRIIKNCSRRNCCFLIDMDKITEYILGNMSFYKKLKSLRRPYHSIFQNIKGS